MRLKIKRNYPLVVFLIAFLSILAFIMGNYPIIAYTIN